MTGDRRRRDASIDQYLMKECLFIFYSIDYSSTTIYLSARCPVQATSFCYDHQIFGLCVRMRSLSRAWTDTVNSFARVRINEQLLSFRGTPHAHVEHKLIFLYDVIYVYVYKLRLCKLVSVCMMILNIQWKCMKVYLVCVHTYLWTNLSLVCEHCGKSYTVCIRIWNWFINCLFSNDKYYSTLEFLCGSLDIYHKHNCVQKINIFLT